MIKSKIFEEKKEKNPFALIIELMEMKRFMGLLNENVGGGLARIIAKALTKNIDEVSTPIKKIIQKYTNNTIDEKKFLDEYMTAIKGTIDEVNFIKILDEIPEVEKYMGDWDMTIRDYATDPGVTKKQLSDFLTDPDHGPNTGSDMIDEYLTKRLLKVLDEVFGETTSLTKTAGKLPKKIKLFIQKLLPENIRTITVAYKNLFKSLDKISMEINGVVDEMVKFKGKYPTADLSDYHRRIKDLATSAVGKNKTTLKKLLDDIVKNNPQIQNDVTLKTELRNAFRSNKLDEYLLPVVKGENYPGVTLYFNAWRKLLNIKSLKSLEGWGRLLNFIVQATPYSTKEISQRIAKYGVKKVVARRLVGTAMTAYVVLPTIAGILNGLYYIVTSFGIDGFRTKFLGYSSEEELFAQSKGSIVDAVTNAAKSVFPDSMLDLPFFTTFIDDVYEVAVKGLPWKPSDEVSPYYLEAANAGMAILKGEDVNIEGYDDIAEGTNKAKNVKEIIKKVYPDIKSTVLAKIYWDASTAKAYYKFNPKGTLQFTPMEIRIKNLNSKGEVVKGVTKIFIVKVENGKEYFKEINTLH